MSTGSARGDRQELREPGPEDEEPLPEPSPAAELKSLYRRLARRFHPDLARTEEEQVRHAALMARINALYRAGDRAGLEALADQALGAELPEAAVSLEEEVRLLEERRERFESARDGLRIELAALRGCATAELLRRARQARDDGRDFFDELRAELAARCDGALGDVRDAAGALEDAVRRTNRRSLATEGRRSLGRAFESPRPAAAGPALARGAAGGEGRSRGPRGSGADGALARRSPAAARLVLFAYASELVPHPLDGLRSYEQLAVRFQHLGSRDEEPATLERALVDAADLVEFGIRRAGERLVQSGLRFRSTLLRDAVPLALRNIRSGSSSGASWPRSAHAPAAPSASGRSSPSRSTGSEGSMSCTPAAAPGAGTSCRATSSPGARTCSRS